MKGTLLLERRRTAEALAVFDEAIELMPENARMFEGRGRARLAAGDKTGALEDVKKAIELDPACAQRIDGSFSR